MNLKSHNTSLITLFFVFLAIYAKSSVPNQSIRDIIKVKIENIDTFVSIDTIHLYATQSLKSVYSDNKYNPIWRKKKEIVEFINEIANAEFEGLNPRDYHLFEINRIQELAELTLNLKAERDMLLTDAFLLYASHITSGKVNPVTLNADWHINSIESDPIEILNATIRSNNFNKSIRNLVPENIVYQNLKASLKQYKALQTNSGWDSIPLGRSIEAGKRDERIPLIRKRLQLTDGYIINENNDTSLIFDADLKKFIIQYQIRQGFSGDGVIDSPTKMAMNVSVNERIKQIEVNMERWRWLPQEFSDYYILVNIANYELKVIKSGKDIAIHKVIAGKPARKTPVFSSKINQLYLTLPGPSLQLF